MQSKKYNNRLTETSKIFFSDLTSDLSHVDLLTFIFQVVSPCGQLIERFISTNLASFVLDMAKNLDLDISNCHGQSYGTASLSCSKAVLHSGQPAVLIVAVWSASPVLMAAFAPHSRLPTTKAVPRAAAPVAPRPLWYWCYQYFRAV